MTFPFWFGLWCFACGLLVLAGLPIWALCLLFSFCSEQGKEDNETL